MSTSNSLSHLKPHKAEAIYRIRLNALGLFTILVLSYLLPVPSLPTAFRHLLASQSRSYSYSGSQLWKFACILESAMASLMVYNIIEAGIAIRYPRAPPPPGPSKSLKTPLSSPVAQSKSPRPFQVLSPNSSPQPQRPFNFNPSASASSPLSTSTSSRMFKNSLVASSSTTNNAANQSSSTANPTTTYAQSPVSTPSRVLHYSVPPSASTTSNASAASTSSEYLATPSPVVSAYRGKHVSGEVGRALDGTYLSRMAAPVEEPSDEED